MAAVYNARNEPGIEKLGQQQQDKFPPMHGMADHKIACNQDENGIAHAAAPANELREQHLPGKHRRRKHMRGGIENMKKALSPYGGTIRWETDDEGTNGIFVTTKVFF